MTTFPLPTFSLAGVPVTRVGFGSMRLAQNGMGTRGAPRDPAVAVDVLRRVIELGITHIDTAEFYRSPDGQVGANDLIRQALHPYSAGLVIATKIGPVFGPGGFGSATAAEVRPLVEANLSALAVDRLDLVYLRIGGMTPPHGESLAARFEALAALQAEGLVGHLGLSNVDAGHLDEAQRIAPVAAIQNLFDPTDPGERALLQRTTAEGIAFVPFGPLGMGQTRERDRDYAAIAARHGATVPQVAIAHVLSLAGNTLAIPGTGSLTHLEDNAAAARLTLTPDDLELLR